MAHPTYLENAPITEALIDIRVKPSFKVGCDAIEAVHEKICGKYPEKQVKKVGKFSLGFKEGETASVKSEQLDTIGFSFCSQDKKKIVQYRVDGFTFNWLKPYTTWEDLRDEAKSLWELYDKTMEPEYISRVALRYINRLELPLPIKGFSDYLTAAPTVPDSLPQELSSFLTRVVTHEPSTRLVAIITQALEAVIEKNETVPIILDIDVFKDVELDTTSQEVWDVLEEIRTFKNKIFFEYITEKAVEVFK